MICLTFITLYTIRYDFVNCIFDLDFPLYVCALILKYIFLSAFLRLSSLHFFDTKKEEEITRFIFYRQFN